MGRLIIVVLVVSLTLSIIKNMRPTLVSDVASFIFGAEWQYMMSRREGLDKINSELAQ